MSMEQLQQALVDWLSGRLTPVPSLLGGALPIASGDLPSVAFSFEECTLAAAGIGNDATSTMHGALAVTADIDLSDPVLHFEDDSVLLLSVDRLHLHLPHAPLVSALGGPPGDPGDVVIEVDGAPRVFMTDFTVDSEAGIVHWNAPLPLSGTLHAEYYVGQWELSTEQLRGTLHIDLADGTALGVEQMTTSLLQALRDRAILGLRKLSPVGMTAIAPGPFDGSRARRVSYQFDYETSYPRLPTGTGPIVRIDWTSQLEGPVGIEQHTIEH